MQIEKPKSALSPGIILLAFIIGLFILCLPFLAKGGASKKTAVAIAPAVVSTPQPETKPLQAEPESEVKEAEPAPAAAVPEVVALPEKNPAAEAPPTPKSVSKSVSSKPVQPSSMFKTHSPALLTSFYGDVKIVGSNGEQKIQKNHQVLEGDTIEVGATGEAVLEIAELYVLRLKPDTKLTHLEPKKEEAFSGKERVTYRFRLEKGAVLGTTKYRGDKIDALNLLIKDQVFDVQDSTFRAQLTDAAPWVGVLRGSMKSGVENTTTPVVIHALEKVPLSEIAATAPVKVSPQEWGLLRETYEMNTKTAVEEAHELDLSKRAGDFFGYVFDHGTFYTEKVGYTVRDFYEEKGTGNVYLEAEYDVFPSNSFVGLYVLTRDLDTRNYAGLKFDVRRKPDEGYPDRFYVEVKSKGQIIHRFEITDIKPNWEARQIDFFNPVSTPITEVTLVFLNQTIGQSKKGFIQMRNLQLIPLNSEQKTLREEADKNPVPVRMPHALPQAPQSLQHAVVTLPVQQARRIVQEDSAGSVPFKSDNSKKIADEVPKVVSFDDLS